MFKLIKFFKWLLCLEPKQQQFVSKCGRMLMNDIGNISLNLDNPEVLAGIHKEMMKYKDIKIMDKEPKAKPEKANVTLIKTIDGYETTVVNTVNYNDDKKVMILNAIIDELHNYDIDDEEEMARLIRELESNDYLTVSDYAILLKVRSIEPFTEKQLDKDMFLTIKYPA